jgi:hypothetical protein
MAFQCHQSSGKKTIDATTFITAGTFMGDANTSGMRQIRIANLGTLPVFIKFGPSTGPDASNSTDRWPQMAIPAGQSACFVRNPSDSHWYAYATAGNDIVVMTGAGEP